jgi:RHH-type transcriptional regulator, proline utilization regulon repressor / proline dehydrogenase / delta 1-pyrroline-5-carboxylate dehydrogenase
MEQGFTVIEPFDGEERTQSIARQILGNSRSGASFLPSMRWEDKLLSWAMSNEHLRVRLFQFIDCLPSLQSKKEIARHLQEYLGEASVELPGPLKTILNFGQPDSVPGQVAAKTIITAVESLAHKYIAGENIPQVLKTLEHLRKNKIAFTLDLLGEAVITEQEAQDYLDKYIDLINQLSAESRRWPILPSIDQAEGALLPRIQISVKLTAFYSQFDPLDQKGSQERVSERVRVLLRHAKGLGVAVHFDMEQYAYKEITLTILKSLLMEEEFRTQQDVGLTIQAYLKDSEQDLKDLISWIKIRGYPITIRLVKGAYWDQETIKAIQKNWPCPVYSDKAQTDLNFEYLTQLLLEQHLYLGTAIGSHNVRSLAKSIALAEHFNVPKSRFEVQMLYGMADSYAKTLAEQGYRVRMYCPYGALVSGMAYLIRRLLENTANTSFLRRSLAMETAVGTELLARPQPRATTVRPKTEFNAADTDYGSAIADQQNIRSLALELVRSQPQKIYWPLIAGERVPTPEIVDSLNPSSPAESLGRVGLVSLEQAEQAVAAAKSAFPAWRKTPVKDRVAILHQAADLLTERRDELAAWMILEVGKPVREADSEVSEAIDFCRYYADEMERLAQGWERNLAGETNRYSYQARGIAVVIPPWNFPLAIATGMAVAALVTGNCVILKPSTQAAVTASELTDILVEAGIPPGVFQYLPGKGSYIGTYLVQHPDTSLIAFTGSQQVGCEVYAEAAVLRFGQNHLKRVIAEMGGKNAIVIDESADLDQAVKGVVHSAFSYSGQKCSACSRVIVLESIHDAFVTRLIEATRSLQIGLAENPGTSVGPLIDASAQQRVRDYIEQGRIEAKVALEMLAPRTGHFVGPVILTEVAPRAVVAQEEIFGPVLAVLKAKDFSEAIGLANDVPYALTGGLYSRTPSHIASAQADFEVGNLYINRGITGAIVNRQPFGGFKLSGIGSKAGGPDYLLQFLEPKMITENIQRQGFAPIDLDGSGES